MGFSTGHEKLVTQEKVGTGLNIIRCIVVYLHANLEHIMFRFLEHQSDLWGY